MEGASETTLFGVLLRLKFTPVASTIEFCLDVLTLDLKLYSSLAISLAKGIEKRIKQLTTFNEKLLICFRF
jgi:hypothetical protein